MLPGVVRLGSENINPSFRYSISASGRGILGYILASHQFITLALIHTANLELPVNLRCMSLHCGRKWKHLEKTLTDTRITYKLHTERKPLPVPGSIEPYLTRRTIGWTGQDVPFLLPFDSWDRLQPTVTLNR